MSKPTSTRVLLSRTLATMAQRVFVVLMVLLTITSVYSITRAGTGEENTAYAAAPTTLNFQARLLNSAGNLVNDGMYNVEFKIYNASSSSGSSQGSCTGDANCLWAETRTGGAKIQVKNGYLSAYLGDTTALPTSIWNQQLYLTMNIGGTGAAGWDGEMTPRIRLTSVPYAFRATIAESAETLSKNTGSFTGTVDFATMTANRSFLFPDTSLATTASPGTICVFNGTASNCPAATGSAFYIQNTGGSGTPQAAANFNIQATNSGVNGTVAGILRGAAGGQTVDLLQFQATNGSVLGAVTAAGNLQVASSIDTYAAGTLSVGNITATAVSICNSAVCDSVNIGTNADADTINVGDSTDTLNFAGTAINITGDTSITGNVTLAASKSLTITGGNTASRPASPTEGMVYYDTTTKQLLVYANGKWQGDRSTATKIVAASNSSQAIKDAADYVADGTGDQVEINAALTAAAGGKVYLAEGTYVANATILIPNNTVLSGAGRGTLIELADLDATDNLIENSDTTTGTGVRIQDLRIDGRSDLNTAGTQTGIYLNGMGGGTGSSARQGGLVSGVIANNFLTYGILLTASSNNIVTANRAQNNAVGGIGTSAGGHYNTITANSVQGSVYGILIGSAGNTISGNTVQGHSNSGIYLLAGQNNTITGNAVSGNAVSGIILTANSNTNTITGNKIYDSGGATTNNAIYVTGSDSNTIASNNINDTSATTTNYGINIFDSTSDTNYLSGNTLGGGSINDVGTGTIYGGQVNGSGNFMIQPAGTIELMKNTNVTGNLAVTGTGSFTGGSLTVATTTATDDRLVMSIATGGAARFDGTLTNADLTAARTWTFQDATGVVALGTAGNSLFFTTTGATNVTLPTSGTLCSTTSCGTAGGGYVQFAPGTVQTDGTNNNSIFINKTSGTGNIIELQKSGVDVFALDNTGNATFSQNVTVASGKSITLIGGNTASRPASPTEGMLYFDTSTKQLLTYANGKWQADRTESVIVAASNSSQADKDAADYVATGTGDQSTINTALTATNGKKVILLAGTYTINASISIPNNTTLAGIGPNTVITIPNSLNTNFVAITNSDTSTGTNITIQDLRLEGNKTNQSGSVAMAGIGLNGVGAGVRSGGRISNVQSNNWYYGSGSNPYYWGSGISSYNSRNNTIVGTTTQGNNYGILLYNNSNTNVVTSNVAFGNTYGITVTTSNSNTVTDNITTNNSVHGISIVSGIRNVITSNIVVSNTTAGISLSISSNFNTISNNSIYDNGSSTTNNGVYITASDSNSITGNNITDTSATTNNYALNILDSTSDTNYLADNALGSGTINDAGTGTIYGGQLNSSGNYLIQPAGTIELMKNTNVTGHLSPTANNTYDLGTSSLAWRTGYFGTSVLTPAVDTATAAALGIGTTNATNITIGHNAGTFAVDGTNFDLATNGVLTLAGGQTADITTQANQNLTVVANGSGTIVLNDTVTAAGTVTFSNVATDITTGTNEDLTIDANGTGNLQLSDNVIVASGKYLKLNGGNTASRPGSPTEGMLYYDTDTHQMLAYNGTKWLAESRDAYLVAANNSSDADKAAADYVADGTADEAEINAALLRADPASVTSGARKSGKVYLFAGTYTTAATISVPNNTTLSGAGKGTLVQFGNLAAVSTNMITNTTSGSLGTGITIRDLKLDGNKTTNSTDTFTGIYLDGIGSPSTNLAGATINNVTIQNFENHGINIVNSANNIITGNTIQTNDDHGILTNNANHDIISDNTITGNTLNGIYFNATARDIVSNNFIGSNGSFGIRIETGNTNTITDNVLRSNTGSGSNSSIMLVNTDTNLITNNNITDTAGTGYAIDISDTGSDANYLSGNTFSGTGASTMHDLSDATGGFTIYGGQVDGSTNYLIQPAGTIELMKNTNVTGTLSASTSVTTPNIDAITSGALGIGNLGTATSVSICNSANCDTISLGTNADTDTIQLGDSLDILTFAGTLGMTGNSTFTGATSGDAFTVSNSTSSGNIAVFKDNSNTVLTIADGGGITGTGTYTFSGVATDITTGTNEDLTVIANGTGTIILNDNVSVAGNLTVTNAGNVAFQNGATADITTGGTFTDYAIGTGTLFRFDGASAQTISSIAGGADGRILTLINASTSFAITIQNDTGGTAANRIITGTGSSLSVPAGSTVQLAYDSDSSRWRVIGGTATSGGGANQQLSNLTGTIAINSSLTPNADNTLDLGSSSFSWKSLYADTSVLTPAVDTAAAGALSIGTVNATNITLGHNAGTFAVDGTNFDVTTAGVITLAGGQTADITTQANQNLTMQANGTGTIVLNDTVTAAGTLTFSNVATDITTGTNEDLTVVANGTGIISLNDSVTVANSLTAGTSAGSGTVFTNNGATFNATLAVSDDSDGGSLGGTPSTPLTAAQSVDIYTAFKINQTTANQTITIPSPTNTAAGRIIYVANIGSASIGLLGSTLNNGSTATLLWNGSAWTFAGADGTSINNQIAAAQNGDFWIQAGGSSTGIGRLDGKLLTPVVDTASAATLNVGTVTANAISISRTGITTTVNGLLTVTEAGQFNGGLTVASNLTVTQAGNVAFQRNTTNYSSTGTQNDINFGTGALFRITSASALTITSIAGGADGRLITLVNASANSVTIQNDSGGTAANRVITGTGANIVVPTTASITLAYDSSSSRWRVIGSTAAANGYVQLQSSTPGTAQTGNLNINGTLIGGTAVRTPLIDTASAAVLDIGTTNATQINLNKNTQITGNVTFAIGSSRSISIGQANAFNSGDNLTIVAGAGGSSTGDGGVLNLQGGGASSSGAYGGAVAIAGGVSSAGAGIGGHVTINGGASGAGGLGGDVTISGGAGGAGSFQGLVNLSTSAFTSASEQTFSSSTSITAGNVNLYSSLPVKAITNTGLTLSVPDPGQNVIGRLLYISARSGSLDFTMRLNAARTPIDIAMKANSTATLIWNGTDWTAAGASSSTDLQSAYNNTLTSAGGAEISLNPTGGAADGFTIRNNGTTPIVGGLLEVQSSIGSNLLSVNNNATEYAVNGGSESATNYSTNWLSTSGAAVTRYTTTGNFIATGVASAQVVASGANFGAKHVFSTALTSGMTYSVSFAVRGTTGFTGLQVYYSADGTTTSSATCTASTAVTTGSWKRVLCNFVATGSITSGNALYIREPSATLTYYIDNLSVSVNANMSFAADGSVDSALGSNWTAYDADGGAGTTTPTRTTGTVYDTAGAVQDVTTAHINEGVRNNMAVTPAVSTQYKVSFYAKSSNTFNDIKVGFLPAGGSSAPVAAQECVDYNTQTVSTTSWTLITCTITTPSSGISDPDLVIYQPTATARTFYVDALTITLNTNNSNNVQIGGSNKGGPTTLLTLDRAASAPIAANNDSYLGSMYYDTTTGRIQCYEADGWGACGSSPDNIITLTPEYAGAVLGGPGNVMGGGAQTPGIGVMTSEFCSSETGVLVVGSLCANHEARNYYHWTSPQATEQIYSIYVSYKLPTTFKAFNDSNTIKLTALSDNNTNAIATLQIFKKKADGSAITACGATAQTINSTTNTWQQTPYDAADETTCSFAGGDNIVFKIDMKSKSNGNIYVENLDFVYTNN